MTPLYHPRPGAGRSSRLRGLLVAVTVVGLLVPWAIRAYQKWDVSWKLHYARKLIEDGKRDTAGRPDKKR